MDIKQDIDLRVEWIKSQLAMSGTNGIVLGNSGGKDSALALMLARLATPNVLGVIMPCESKVNYGSDRDDAKTLADQIGIESIEIELTDTKLALREATGAYLKGENQMVYANMNPRLRMAAVYAIAQDRNYLVAGTSNLSEYVMGYFTKWGDGGSDINPIADLTASEVFEYLKVLNAPKEIIQKEPSAGLYEGQTDEIEMGVRYADIDKVAKNFIKGNFENPGISSNSFDKILKAFKSTEHKRSLPKRFGID